MQRERIAQEKAKQEAVNRRVLANEREQNRMRKLKAQGGREWDAEKEEERNRGDFGEARRGGQYRRGMHGGIAGDVAKTTGPGEGTTPVEEDWGGGRGFRGRGRGRGGRGHGRGRGDAGRGRGSGRWNEDRDQTNGAQEITSKALSKPPSFDTVADFPALPGGNPAAPAEKGRNASESLANLDLNSPEPAGTWADQMESDLPAPAPAVTVGDGDAEKKSAD